MIVADPLPAAVAGLVEAILRSLAAPRPITVYGCQPLTPAREAAPGRPCPLCGARRPAAEGPPPAMPDGIVCGLCHRASDRVQARCDGQLRRDARDRAAGLANRKLTEGTPLPPILAEAPATPPVPAPQGRRRPRPCPKPKSPR